MNRKKRVPKPKLKMSPLPDTTLKKTHASNRRGKQKKQKNKTTRKAPNHDVVLPSTSSACPALVATKNKTGTKNKTEIPIASTSSSPDPGLVQSSNLQARRTKKCAASSSPIFVTGKNNKTMEPSSASSPKPGSILSRKSNAQRPKTSAVASLSPILQESSTIKRREPLRKKSSAPEITPMKRSKRAAAQQPSNQYPLSEHSSEEEDPFFDEAGSDPDYDFTDDEDYSDEDSMRGCSPENNMSDTDLVHLQKDMDFYLSDAPLVDISLKPIQSIQYTSDKRLETIFEETETESNSNKVVIKFQANKQNQNLFITKTNSNATFEKKQTEFKSIKIEQERQVNINDNYLSDGTDNEQTFKFIYRNVEKLAKLCLKRVNNLIMPMPVNVTYKTQEEEMMKVDTVSNPEAEITFDSLSPSMLQLQPISFEKLDVIDNDIPAAESKARSQLQELRNDAIMGNSSFDEEVVGILKAMNPISVDAQSEISSRDDTPSRQVEAIHLLEDLQSLRSVNSAAPSYSTITNASHSDDQDSIFSDATDEEQSNKEHSWSQTTKPIPQFDFDYLSEGLRVQIPEDPVEIDFFELVFSNALLDHLINCTNIYGENLSNKNRPHSKNSRNQTFRPVNRNEMLAFLGLCLLRGQLKFPKSRNMFSSDALYYHPIFQYVMSGRRFEQILRNLTTSDIDVAGAAKVVPFLESLMENFRRVYGPSKELSIDESLLLHRGRLHFRQYMKSKKARYGIKFYELTTADGFVLNIIMYAGKEDETDKLSKKTEQIVMKLLRPYLHRGHHLFMDNYYNDVELSQKLLAVRTHTCGTLRKSRKTNPKVLTAAKLKKGNYFWRRKGNVYVSVWKDKRPVLAITTRNHPQMKIVSNRFGKTESKPAEVAEYNRFMGGIDRKDQMVSYYSSPPKTVRWHKKVIFHLLDVAIWNAYYLYKKYFKRDVTYEFLTFRDNLIKQMLKIDPEAEGKNFVRTDSIHCSRRTTQSIPQFPQQKPPEQMSGHWPESIPCPTGSKRNFKYLNCAMCTKNKKRKETKFRCKGCIKKTPLCPECFEAWHLFRDAENKDPNIGNATEQ